MLVRTALPPPHVRCGMNRMVFTILRDVLHESAYNQCAVSSDTCATWEPAFELADLLDNPSNPAAFDAWHTKWYVVPRRRKTTVKEWMQRRNRRWWHVT
jgi:hypothetical protein